MRVSVLIDYLRQTGHGDSLQPLVMSNLYRGSAISIGSNFYASRAAMRGIREFSVGMRPGRGGFLAGVAATSMLIAGLLVAPAAFASDPVTDHAPTEDEGYREFVEGLIAADPAVTAVSQDGKGNIIVAAVEGTLADDTRSQLSSFTNVVIKDRPAVLAHAIDDVVGGAGYVVNRATVCSFGFSGWSPTGAPAIITAGHCGATGAVVERTAPSHDDGPYFPTSEPRYAPALLDQVGVVGFSQWGGPAGAAGAEGDLNSTDIAAINVTNTSLRLLPRVTDWRTAASEDLSLSGFAVTAVGTVEVGDLVTRSGRSTGVASGVVVVDASGTVIEDKSWSKVCEVVTPVPANCHWVYGFWTDAVTRPGDSGGPFMRGTTAVGVLSGGGGGLSFATDLANGLRLSPGYTVMLDLLEPVVTSAATVAPGGVVRGSGNAGLTLTVTTPATAFDVPIGGDGTWSFPAPTSAGSAAYVLQTKDAGFNRSEEVPFTLTVDAALLAKPVITAPVDGASIVGQALTFSGTGEPGSTITLAGGAAASTTVAADGSWSVATSVDYGAVSVSVTQSIHGVSATTSVHLAVAPPAPTLTGLIDGAALDAPPTHITGTALAGATISVVLDGQTLQSVVAQVDPATRSSLASWSVPVPTGLAAGPHEVRATQAVGGIASAQARLTFTVVAAPDPVATPTPGGASPGALSDTGIDSSAAGATTAFGCGLLLTGALMFMVLRRRRNGPSMAVGTDEAADETR